MMAAHFLHETMRPEGPSPEAARAPAAGQTSAFGDQVAPGRPHVVRVGALFDMMATRFLYKAMQLEGVTPTILLPEAASAPAAGVMSVFADQVVPWRSHYFNEDVALSLSTQYEPKDGRWFEHGCESARVHLAPGGSATVAGCVAWWGVAQSSGSKAALMVLLIETQLGDQLVVMLQEHTPGIWASLAHDFVFVEDHASWPRLRPFDWRPFLAWVYFEDRVLRFRASRARLTGNPVAHEDLSLDLLVLDETSVPLPPGFAATLLALLPVKRWAH